MALPAAVLGSILLTGLIMSDFKSTEENNKEFMKEIHESALEVNLAQLSNTVMQLEILGITKSIIDSTPTSTPAHRYENKNTCSANDPLEVVEAQMSAMNKAIKRHGDFLARLEAKKREKDSGKATQRPTPRHYQKGHR